MLNEGDRKPKYNPDGTFIRLDEVPAGHYAEVFITGPQGIVVRNTVVVEKNIKTKQERNPMVKTTGGQVLGGGTSVKVR